MGFSRQEYRSGVPFPSLGDLFDPGIKFAMASRFFTTDPPGSEVNLLSHVRLFETPMDYGLPGSSVRGIFQARVLESVAVFFFRRSSQPRDRTQGSNPGLPQCRQVLYPLSHWGSPIYIQSGAGLNTFLFLLQISNNKIP